MCCKILACIEKFKLNVFTQKRKKIALRRYFIKYANVACMVVHFSGSVIKQTKPTTSFWLRVKKSRIDQFTNKSSLFRTDLSYKHKYSYSIISGYKLTSVM